MSSEADRRTTVSITISDWLLGELRAEAKRENRSVSNMLETVLLDRYEAVEGLSGATPGH